MPTFKLGKTLKEEDKVALIRMAVEVEWGKDGEEVDF